jgi:hypothetical protein
MKDFDKNMDTLLAEYEEDGCNFTPESCVETLMIYVSRVQDSHFKCALYKHLKYLEEK